MIEKIWLTLLQYLGFLPVLKPVEAVIDTEDEALAEEIMEPAVTKIELLKQCLKRNLKHCINILLVAVMLAGIYMSSAKKAEAGMILGDHRYTSGAVAADMAQCAAMIAIWYAARVFARVTLTSLMTSLLAWCGFPWGAGMCAAGWTLYYMLPYLVEVAGAAALYGAWLAFELWAEETRKATNILNNFDEGEEYYCEKFDHRSEFYKFGAINTHLGDCNQPVYTKNEHYNQIAVYYDKNNNLPTGSYGAEAIEALGTASPSSDSYVWISPYDCKTLEMSAFKLGTIDFAPKRWVCAYEESGKICADIVFCTSLEIIQFIKYVLPGMFFFNKVTGYVADPVFSSGDAFRNCGSNPWSGSRQDDYQAGDGRCECACCDGTENKPSYCDDTITDNEGNSINLEFSCKTYNERYLAHCIPKPQEVIDIDPPVVSPGAISAYCDARVDVGYTPFPFAGKLMRCFEKTLNNVLYGTKEIPEYDEDGKYLIENGAIVMTEECAEGTKNAAGFCDSSMFYKVMHGYQNVIRLMLIIFVTFVGLRMMMGANYAFSDIFKMIMKISLVSYFSLGDAWRDGYYNTLLTMGAEIGAEYYAVSDAAYEYVSDSMQTQIDATTGVNSVECNVTATGSASALVVSLDECNYTNGYGYDNNVYSDADIHFAPWDMLDCKFATYTGFTINKTFPFIVSFAFGALLSVSTGFMTLIAALAILYASMLIILSALYVGIIVLFNITLLIYLAPLVIPLALFEYTRSIFSKWLALLLGFSLQPMVLFALLSFMYAILDSFFTATMPQIYSSEINSTNIGLGITGYKVSSSQDFGDLVVAMIKFTIAMVLMSILFVKANSLLRDLTGATIGKIPKFGKNIEKAAGAAGTAAWNAGKYANRYRKFQANKMGENRRSAVEGMRKKGG